MRTLTTLAKQCVLSSTLFVCGLAVQAAEPTPSTPASAQLAGDPDNAWLDLLRKSRLPEPPAAWETNAPGEAEVEKFQAAEGERMAKAAAQAGEFYRQFPRDARAEEAKAKEYELLSVAAQLGNTNVLARLEALEAVRLNDPLVAEEDRFHIAATAVNRRAMARLSEGRTAALAELETGARALLSQFPNRTETYEMLQMVALESEPEKASKLAREIAESSAPAQVKDAIKPLLLLGKPLAIQFKAVDEREVDLGKLRGKVVLVDFWATWCGPCVQELPNVLAAYEKLHAKGFEIIGISFDRDKERLLSFVKDHKIPWPQYFDGKQWDNEFGKQFGIQSIPTMWLVDKKGILRDVNAHNDLAGRVEKLLAENP